MSDMFEPATVIAHNVHCPRCSGYLMGLCDVTVHPRVQRKGKELVPGPLLTRMRDVKAKVDASGLEMFNDLLVCQRYCGYEIYGHELERQIRGLP